MWNSKASDMEVNDTAKMLEEISNNRSLPIQEQAKQGAEVGGNRGEELKVVWAKKRKEEIGSGHAGLSIDDLFVHSFCPHSRNSICPTSHPPITSRWFWIPATRVWDPAAERYLATVQEIGRFGEQAKHLR
jgi:hypothetical protein